MTASSPAPIVIVGYSFKLPQDAEDEAGFWEILESKRNVMTEWPEDRINIDGFDDNGDKRLNMLYARGGHFLKEDIAAFDAPFFSTTAAEAAAMDPQQRLALEASYHAMENAGIPVEKMRGSDMAVFAATMTDDYTRLMFRDTDTMPRTGATGTVRATIPNRISWFFDLRGPSMHVDTACSGSLAALDLACQAMNNGDAKSALVLGANVLLTPDWSFSVGNMNMLSPDSLCYSFDQRANGYSRGEGIVALLLKPLDEALRNGDMVRAVIRATSSNQDGQTPTFTQPSPIAQEALIRHTYAKAGLDLSQTRYCEAHGTGTQTGDPIEMKAIGRVFADSRSRKEPLYVGSVKANIGHLEGASGLAGVLKVIMALEKGVIPPNALFEKLNKNIDADGWNLRIPTRNIPWPTTGIRRASVNSFGFGGANSHVILDDAYHYLLSHRLRGYHHCQQLDGNMANGTYQHVISEEGVSTPKLLVWSAADKSAISRMSQDYRDYLTSRLVGNDAKLGQLAYTLAARRSMMAWRSFAVVDADGLKSGVDLSVPVRSSRENKESLAWVFTGQGAQYIDMGMELMDHYPVFKESLLKSDMYLARMGCPWSLFDAVRNAGQINRPELSQPLCTIVQIALVDLLRTLGIQPKAVVGHSSGEIAAGYAVGALCHESAISVAYLRGVYAGKLVDMMATKGSPGAMMSVNLRLEQVPAYLAELGLDEEQARIACFNSPTNLTLSGQVGALQLLKQTLDKDGIFAHLVNTGVAYHSPAVLAVADELLAAANKRNLRSDYSSKNTIGGQKIPMFSTVSGKKIDLKVVETARYWVTNLTSQVRFVDAIQSMAAAVPELADIIEIGPHAALKRPILDSAPTGTRYLPALERKKSPLRTILSLLGGLFSQGYHVNILAGNNQQGAQMPLLVDCPRYPFNHSNTYWHESRLSKGYRFRQASPGYLIGRRANDWNPLRPRWRNWLCTETSPWLGHHKISNTTVCPGTGMLTMAIEAARQMATGPNISGFRIKDAEFLAPIRVGETVAEAVETEVELVQINNGTGKNAAWSEVRIFEHHNDRTTQCFRGLVQVEYEDNAVQNPIDQGLETRLAQERLVQHVEQAEARCAKSVDSAAFYNFCERQGLYYGDAFAQLRDIRWDTRNTSTARIDMMEARRHWGNNVDSPLAHPAVLDAAVHLVMAQVSSGLTGEMPTMIPQKLQSMWISARSWVETCATVRLSSDLVDRTSASVGNTVYVLADDASPLCAIERLTMARVSKPKEAEVVDKLLYNITWKPLLSSLSPEQVYKMCQDSLHTFLDVASHETPSLKILDMGGDTQGITRSILDRLSAIEEATDQARFSEYVFLDKANGSLDLARAEFTKLERRVHLRVVDANKASDGRDPGSFHLVVVDGSALLHSDLEEALQRASAYLGPRGHLLMTGADTSLDWNQLLSRSGFDGVHMGLSHDNHSTTPSSTFASRKADEIAPGPESPAPRAKLVLVIDNESDEQKLLAAEVSAKHPGSTAVVDLAQVGISDWVPSSTDNVVSLLEVGRPRLHRLSGSDLDMLQQLIRTTQRLLWVTATAPLDDALSSALYAPATGLLRTLRSEDSTKHIVSLTIESTQPGTEVNHVLHVLESYFNLTAAPLKAARVIERELVVREGMLHVPRIAREIALDKERVSRIVPKMRTEKLGLGPALELKVGTQGMLDTLHYVQDNTADSDLKPGEVEIRATAWPISFRDVFIALGRLGDEGLGYDCAGIVTRSTAGGLVPGDRVVMVLEGCFKTNPRAPAQNVVKIPDGVETNQAVAAVLPGITAYHSLVNVARLRRGDTILVHSAAGATGQMAVAVALMLGAQVFATVGFPDKKQLLVDRFGLEEDHIFYSRDTSFAAGIMRMTGGRGVDCVLNCLAGEAVRASFEALAPNGRMVEIGKADIKANSALAMGAFSMNRTYSGVDMLHLLNTDISVICPLVQKVLELIADPSSGVTAPSPLHLYSAPDAERAFRYMQGGKNSGRIVITLNPEDQFQKLLTHRSAWTFDTNASYVIGGGLGGIGRAMVRWMASRGARNLILLSRSGASSGAACSLLSELEATYPDIQIYAPRCDVSSAEDLAKVLKTCSETMPPIQGCINGIMNLKDSIFENMTHAQWSATIASKVTATWNLHNLLPPNLDFFILLSSLSGIYGAVGQSNYAAGCAFQDALARARSAASGPNGGPYGRCSVSFNLGWMRTIGVIAESDLSAEYLRNRESSRDSSAVEAEDLLALLEHYCDPAVSVPVHGSQVLVGAVTPADFLARGEEVTAVTMLGNAHLFAGFDVPSAFSSGSAGGAGTTRPKGENHVGALFQQAADATAKSEVVTTAIKAKVARAMGVAVEDVDGTKRPSDYGVDSLMAVELRNWTHKTFGAAVAVFEIMGGISIRDVGDLVTARSEGGGAVAA